MASKETLEVKERGEWLDLLDHKGQKENRVKQGIKERLEKKDRKENRENKDWLVLKDREERWERRVPKVPEDQLGQTEARVIWVLKDLREIPDLEVSMAIRAQKEVLEQMGYQEKEGTLVRLDHKASLAIRELLGKLVSEVTKANEDHRGPKEKMESLGIVEIKVQRELRGLLEQLDHPGLKEKWETWELLVGVADVV